MPADFDAVKVDTLCKHLSKGPTWHPRNSSFSLIKTPFAYKQIKAKQRLLHKYTLFEKFVKRFADFIEKKFLRHNPHYEKMGLDERREKKDERSFKDKRHSREGGNLLASISKDEIPFDIPKNWVWCKLGNLFFIQLVKH